MALVKRDFIEKNNRKVVLCAEDDPNTFMIITEFLYCKSIELDGKSANELVNAIRSAHRWTLDALVSVLCRYMHKADRLCTNLGVIPFLFGLVGRQ